MNNRSSASTGQVVAAMAGIAAVAALDQLGFLPNTGASGLPAAIRAALFYGLGGAGGGLIIYEIVRRIRDFAKR
jgi:hypothetical protein